MNGQEYKQHKQHAFEVYCKTVLRNRARNIHRRLNYTKQHEVSFERLETEEMTCAAIEDQYNVSCAINTPSIKIIFCYTMDCLT